MLKVTKVQLSLFIVSLLMLAPAAHAEFVSPIGITDPAKLVARLALIFLEFAAPLAVAGVVWGGVQYILAFGNEKKIESAKHVIWSSLIGLGIILMAGVIVFTFSKLLGAPIGINTLLPGNTALAAGGTFGAGWESAKENIIDAGGLVSGNKDLVSAIFSGLGILLAFMAAVAVAVIIVGGFRYMVSGGNEKKTEGAKKMIISALIGLVIIGFSVALVNFLIAIVKK